MLVPKPIVGKILRGEATLAFRLSSTRRPRIGERLYVKAKQRDEVACHVTVLDVQERPLGTLTYDDARAMGYRTSVDVQVAWVLAHDEEWLAAFEIPDTDDEMIRSRFDAKHARRRGYFVSFVLDTSEQPIMLMQGSPLTDGGKARLMSNRKIPPGRAKSSTLSEGSPETHGYASPGPRAMPGELEPVDRATAERYAKEGHDGFAAREAQREADRDRLGLEERLRLARQEARARGTDVDVQEQAILRRIKAIENKARRRT